MKHAICVLIFAVGTLFPTMARSESEVVFQKDGHECRLDYDRTQFSKGTLDSDNFRLFEGPNEDTYFRVTALANDENFTPGDIRQEFLRESGAKKLVYNRETAGFLVMSGHQGRNIFYTKISLSPDSSVVCVLHIYYPRKDKKAFDRRVTRMSRSFVALN